MSRKLYSCQEKWNLILETAPRSKQYVGLTLNVALFNKNETENKGRFPAMLIEPAGMNDHSPVLKCVRSTGG